MKKPSRKKPRTAISGAVRLLRVEVEVSEALVGRVGLAGGRHHVGLARPNEGLADNHRLLIFAIAHERPKLLEPAVAPDR
eukprot:scaffold133907_cov25-Tisochrysis_lutea.AAC.3